jgi:arabinan endo-1,5-alpha-L-arabinosidase
VAWSDSPTGPWTTSEAPLIEPRRGNGEGCDFLWTYDPEVVETPDGRRFIYYGSFYGGSRARELEVAEDGSLSADPATAVPVTIPNRYEGPEVLFHDDAWWLFVSASNCCNGPRTGYGVFVDAPRSLPGPSRPRGGVDARGPVGGTPVLMQNGNGWVGPGHNTVLTDRAGQWWTLYHAVEQAAPWFGNQVGFTRRPLMLDRLDWVDGWPVVAGGPSEEEARAATEASGGSASAVAAAGSARRPDPEPRTSSTARRWTTLDLGAGAAGRLARRGRPGVGGSRTPTSTRTATTRRCFCGTRPRATS